MKLVWACTMDLYRDGGKLQELGEGETIMYFMKYIFLIKNRIRKEEEEEKKKKEKDSPILPHNSPDPN